MKKLITLLIAFTSTIASAQLAGQYQFLQRRSGVGTGYTAVYLDSSANNIITFNGASGLTSIPRSTFSLSSHTHTFSSLTSKPTTLSGYGITDAQPLDADLTAIAALSTTSFGRGALALADAAAFRTYIEAGASGFDGAFSSLTGKPTTIAGYGITDFNSLGDARWSLLSHTHLSADITNASLGGNGALDAGKLVKFRSDGGIYASGNSSVGLLATSSSGDGVNASSTDGDGGHFTSTNNSGVRAIAQGAEPAITAVNTSTGFALDASTGTGIDIARFTDGTGLGITVLFDGGLDWTSATGATETARNLPVFTTNDQGVVPPSTGSSTETLRGDGTWVESVDIELSGDVTGSGTDAIVTTISADAITNAKLADMPAAAFKGRASGAGTGNPTDLNADQASAILDAAADPFLRTSGAGGYVSTTRTINTTSPLSGGGNLGSDRTISIADAAADGATKGAATFAAADFNSTSGTISIDYTNGQAASASNKGLLTSADWSTFNSKLSGASGTETAYTGTITFGFSSGSTAPSGASNLRQFYTEVGNCVTWQISITYANAGANVNNVTLTFPTQFPTPAIPTGFTGASARLWNCAITRLMTTPTASPTNGTGYMIARNAANTGFEISSASFTAGAYRTFIFSGTYFTN